MQQQLLLRFGLQSNAAALSSASAWAEVQVLPLLGNSADNAASALFGLSQ